MKRLNKILYKRVVPTDASVNCSSPFLPVTAFATIATICEIEDDIYTLACLFSALGMQAPASSALGMQALKIDAGTPLQRRVPTNKMASSKLQSLLTSLQKANWAYHNTDKPTMTDAEYDRGVAELRRLSPAHPFLKVVGAPPAGR